ncbi:sensor histidine kinase [Sinorhizobium meliloti]|uniref:sensor histidine kinase n=1 Tax=Rhizobium meliloti TaxID=382 RepID=UPI00398D2E43
MPGFSVDTKLFRELGELLVGRESTALVELIKNSYDADATKVTIFGERISTPTGTILVSDNGTGMTETEFANGFLRIAGRSKSGANARSPWFQRRYTGEKGVGRLAAHKLARVIEIVSRRWDGTERDMVDGFSATEELKATINWDKIEALETLDQIENSDAVSIKIGVDGRRQAGTALKLSPLRKHWSDRDREQFLDEVATLTPALSLIEPLEPSVTTIKPLLSALKVRDELRPGGFEVDYSGDLALSESELPATAESASWIIEIDCNKDLRRLRILVMPTRRTRTEFSNAEPFVVDRILEKTDPAVGFQARIFQRSNGSWPKRYQGVRVYFEGFRVLPYGDIRDDWLQLDRDYRSRGHSELGRLRKRLDWELPAGNEKELLAVQGNTAFFGAVLLTRSGADELEMLVNREGFVPSEQFDFINDTVRLAIDLQVRLRYAATSEVKQARQITKERQQRAAQRAATNQAPTAYNLRELHQVARQSLDKARVAISSGRPEAAQAELIQLEENLQSATDLGDEVISEATMFRVVASLGLEQAAFVHEVRSLALTAQALADALEGLARETTDEAVATRLRAISAEMRQLRERLRRNAVYLADVTGVEGRKRRSRQALRERVERVLGFFETALARRGGTVEIDIPSDLQTPPLFPAELVAIVSNLLSNAIKFMGEAGRVRVSADVSSGKFKMRFENTGDKVDLHEAERWFEPFRSTTTSVDEALGQGMGLGLTITRSLIDEYGGTIRFITPSTGYATAIEVEFPRP